MKSIYKISKFILIFSIILAWTFNFPPTPFLKNFGGQGWPQIWQNPPIPPKIQEAQAAWGAPKIGSLVKQAGAVGAGDITLVEPAGIAQGDLMVACIGYRGSESFSLPSGWALVATQQSSGDVDATNGIASGVMAYIVRGASAPNLIFPRTITVANSVAQGRIIAYSGGSATPYDTGSANTLAAAAFVVTTASITTAEAGELLVAMVSVGDNDTTSAFDAATDPTTASGATDTTTAPTAGTWIERSDDITTTGADNGLAIADAIRAAAGITGTIQATVADDSRNVMIAGAFKLTPPTTTLGDGINPSNATIGPGGAVTDLDAFTLVANAGTDTVTAATVTLDPAGAFNNIAQADITDASNVAQCTAITNPLSNTLSFTGCTIPVTTTATTFKVRITPKTHAAMPAVPGASYAVTGTVTAFTSTNVQAGTDTGSATITVDNLSPAEVTSASGSSGDTQVSLSWTNPADSDYHSAVVLRSTSAVVATPVEGTTYIVGNTIGVSTVACVVATPTASCTDTGLTNGTAYHYKIFTRDNFANYSATGVVPTGSPFTPSAPSLTFSISDITIGFGTWSGTEIRYATGDTNGSTTEPGAGLPTQLTASTNAPNGLTITVRSTGDGSNAGLYKSATPTKLIAAVASSAVVADSEGYGVYGKNASLLTIDEGFDNDGVSDLAVSFSAQTFASASATVSSGTVDLSAKAAIAGTTPAGSYSDALTLVCTGNF